MKENKSIFEYAKEIDRKASLMTYYDVYSILLKDLNCVVCLESAADLLGYSNGGYRSHIKVYSETELNKPYLKCFLVKNLKNIPFINYDGIKVTPICIAINEMLERNTTDDQILYETFANYYCENDNSYRGLRIPKNLSIKAKHFKKEGKLFYG